VLPAEPESFQSVTTFSITHTGRFTEYALPSGFDAASLADGPSPYTTVWFPSCDGTANISRLSAGTGAVATFKPPAGYAPYGCVLGKAAGYFWYPLANASDSAVDFARVTTSGAIGVFDTDVAAVWAISNIVQRADGSAWFGARFRAGYCRTVSGTPGIVEGISASGLIGAPIHLPQAWTCPASAGCFCVGYYEPIALAEAADKNLYVTAYFAGGYNGYSGSAVLKVPAAGSITRFALPSGAVAVSIWPGGTGALPIASGPDGALWLGESGLNRIARMTTSGSFSSAGVPTAASGISSITAVPGTIDSASALWFTESSANKIARIGTLSKTITEITVPSAGARPVGIIPCEPAVCGTHGGVWFAEPGVRKIARYNFP
jgi:streptogramin lyase